MPSGIDCPMNRQHEIRQRHGIRELIKPPELRQQLMKSCPGRCRAGLSIDRILEKEPADEILKTIDVLTP